MNRSFALLRSVIVSIAFVSLWVWFFPRWFIGPLHIVHPEAWSVIVAGGLISGWCAFEFAWRGRGTPFPLDPPRRLIITGLYRHVRNPMYVGMAVVLAGEAWLTGRVEIIYEMLIAVILATALVVIREEHVLRERFGDDYVEYCRNVRRWIPRLTPWTQRQSSA